MRHKAHKTETGLKFESPHQWKSDIEQYGDGQEVEVSVKEWKNSRSLQQNRLYWEWLTIIGNEIGYTKEELHEVLLHEFAPVVTYTGLNGKPIQKRVRTSAMNTKQMAEYLDAIDRFAAEQSISLPQPETVNAD